MARAMAEDETPRKRIWCLYYKDMHSVYPYLDRQISNPTVHILRDSFKKDIEIQTVRSETQQLNKNKHYACLMRTSTRSVFER